MKKFFILLTLLASSSLYAQTLKGDMDDDGKLTIADVTKLIEDYLNYEDPQPTDDQNASATDLLNKLSAGTCSFNGSAATPMSGHYYSNGVTNYIDASCELGITVRMDLGIDHVGTPIDFTSLTSKNKGQVHIMIGMQDPEAQQFSDIFMFSMNEGQYWMSLDGETEYPVSFDPKVPTQVAAKSGFLKATKNGQNLDVEIALVLKSGNTFACKFTARYTELN